MLMIVPGLKLLNTICDLHSWQLPQLIVFTKFAKGTAGAFPELRVDFLFQGRRSGKLNFFSKRSS